MEGRKVWQNYQTFETAEGEVIQNILITSQHSDVNNPTYYYESTTYRAVISFETLDGTPRTFTESSGSYPAKYEIGDTVTILYKPSDPSDAMIKSWELWFVPALLLGLSVVPLLGCGTIFIPALLIYWFTKKRTNRLNDEALGLPS